MRPLRLMLRRSALALVSLLVSLAAAELVLRATGLGVHDVASEMRKYADFLVWDEGGGYFRHPPNTSALLRGVTASFNSLGMRDDEPRMPKPAGVFRILCLGDSMTFGQGVAQDRIWPALLRSLMAGPRLDFVAAGVGGWNTVEEERFLAGNIERLAPDLVVLLYVTNDNEELDPFVVTRRRTERWPTRVLQTLILRSRLVEWSAFVYRTRIAGTDWTALQHLASRNEEAAAHGEPFAPTDVGWLASRDALDRMVQLTRRQKARLVVVLFNFGGGDFGAGRVATAALARLREFGAVAEVPIVDGSLFLAGHDPLTLVNSPLLDSHPNAEGHALLAAGIARVLRDGAFLPAR